MATASMDLELRPSTTLVRPGDTLVVAIARTLSYAEMDEMKAQFDGLLPGVRIVVVDQCSGLAAFPSER